MADECRIVTVDDEPIRVRGAGEMSAEDLDAFAEVVRAAKAKYDSEEHPPLAHDPCCSSHGEAMTCARYRRTHFVEVRPCCSADAERLGLEVRRDG